MLSVLQIFGQHELFRYISSSSASEAKQQHNSTKCNQLYTSNVIMLCLFMCSFTSPLFILQFDVLGDNCSNRNTQKTNTFKRVEQNKQSVNGKSNSLFLKPQYLCEVLLNLSQFSYLLLYFDSFSSPLHLPAHSHNMFSFSSIRIAVAFGDSFLLVFFSYFFFVNLFCHTQFAWLSNCVRIEPITTYAHKNGPAKYDGLIGSMALILLLFSFQMFNASHFSHCLDFYCIFHLKQILLPIHIQRLKHKK